MSIQFQAHRGVSTEAPENTMAAFYTAVVQRYKYIELDPEYTSDGFLVVLHDKTVNRTARQKNGEKISEEMSIHDFTLKQALELDFGLSFGVKFKGEKIPLLKDVLKFAEKNAVKVKIDNKWQGFPTKIKQKLFALCKAYPLTAQLTVNSVDEAKTVLSALPEVFIHYDGVVNDAVLSQLQDLLPKDRLAVWMPVQSPLTSWVKVPFLSEQWAKKIKRMALLGVWILKTEKELCSAIQLDADIAETPGQCKPEQNQEVIYDLHTHSLFSHDSDEDSANTKREVQLQGFTGVAVTDHCDIEFCEKADVITPIVRSCKQAKEAGNLTGIELGEGIYFPDTAQRAWQAYPYDVILGSVHAARVKNYDMPYSGIDFSAWSEENIKSYFSVYLEDMKQMILTVNFDVLAHLSCPLRYINGKYGKNLKLSDYEKQITEILQMIINRGIALEINTSCMGSSYNEMMPEDFVIRKYVQMGGYLITLGSDAHVCTNAAHEFKRVIAYLLNIGINNVYYFQNRTAIPCKLK